MATLGGKSRKRPGLRKKSIVHSKELGAPSEEAGSVRNAIARFTQVEGVSDAERARAWKLIVLEAAKFDLEIGDKVVSGRGGKATEGRGKKPRSMPRR